MTTVFLFGTIFNGTTRRDTMTPRLIRGGGESAGLSEDARRLQELLSEPFPVVITPDQFQAASNVSARLEQLGFTDDRIHAARRELQGGDVLKRPRRLTKV